MNMYINNLSTTLNQSDEHDQALRAKLLVEAYAPKNTEPNWISRGEFNICATKAH